MLFIFPVRSFIAIAWLNQLARELWLGIKAADHIIRKCWCFHFHTFAITFVTFQQPIVHRQQFDSPSSQSCSFEPMIHLDKMLAFFLFWYQCVLIILICHISIPIFADNYNSLSIAFRCWHPLIC